MVETCPNLQILQITQIFSELFFFFIQKCNLHICILGMFMLTDSSFSQRFIAPVRAGQLYELITCWNLCSGICASYTYSRENVMTAVVAKETQQRHEVLRNWER